MHELATHDWPREKLDRHGACALGDNELLAVLIGHGRRGSDALALAGRMLGLSGGVRGLTRVRREQLIGIPREWGPSRPAGCSRPCRARATNADRPHATRPRFATPRMRRVLPAPALRGLPG